MSEPITPVINEAYVLGEMSTDLRAQYDVWVALSSANAAVLLRISDALVLEFRAALLAIPGVVLLPGCLTAPCYPYFLTLVWYQLSLEMGLVVTPSMAMAYCNADAFLRHLRETASGPYVPIGEGWGEDATVYPTPSYVVPEERPAREID